MSTRCPICGKEVGSLSNIYISGTTIMVCEECFDKINKIKTRKESENNSEAGEAYLYLVDSLQNTYSENFTAEERATRGKLGELLNAYNGQVVVKTASGNNAQSNAGVAQNSTKDISFFIEKAKSNKNIVAIIMKIVAVAVWVIGFISGLVIGGTWGSYSWTQAF